MLPYKKDIHVAYTCKLKINKTELRMHGDKSF